MTVFYVKNSSSAPYALMYSPTLHPHHVDIASACNASPNTGMELRSYFFDFLHFQLFHSLTFCWRSEKLFNIFSSFLLMSFLFLLFPSLLISYFHLSFQVFKCPLCKKSFEKRPDLQINRTLREITDQYKSMKNGVVKNKSGRKGTGGHGSPSSHLFDELKKKLCHPVQKTHQTFSRSKKTSVSVCNNL